MATTAGISVLSSFPIAEKVSPAPQQSRPLGQARRPEYMFIHTVRFWCMLAIVFMHAGIKFIKYEPLQLGQLSLVVQPFKFGTIGFFLISGFLLGDRLPKKEPLNYLRRRANRLIPAWIFWFGLQTAYMTCRALLLVGRSNLTAHVVATTAWAQAGRCLTGTALWFVPNFMVALTCVVLCRRWLNDLRLGAIFLAANLFYSVNVYMCWIPSSHTEAVFGFVFYLWLGAWCANHKETLERWTASVGMGRLLTCIGLATAGAMVEAQLLSVHHLADPLNTLRFCNQAYSILVVILLVRIKRATWPRSVDVGATTYGIHLTHSMVVAVLFAAAAPFVFKPDHVIGYAGVIAVWSILAPVSYVTALLLAKMFGSLPWPWIVGVVRNEAPARSAQLAGDLRPATSGS